MKSGPTESVGTGDIWREQGIDAGHVPGAQLSAERVADAAHLDRATRSPRPPDGAPLAGGPPKLRRAPYGANTHHPFIG